MLKKIIIGATVNALIIGLSGCGGGPGQLQVKPMSNLSVSDRTKILTINFPKIDPVSGEKVKFNLNNYDFTDQILKFSQYAKFHMIENAGTELQYYEGLKVQKTSNKYILNYENGELNDHWFLNSTKFTIFYKKLNNNKISFTLDNKYEYQPYKDLFETDIDPLDSLQNLENDSKNILSKLGTLKIIFHKRYHLKGNINNKYKADSIYANFKRLMGEYNWNSYYNTNNNEKLTEVKKENTFNLKVNNKSIPLHVEVYPYRNGSKVEYEAYLPYTISSDGKVSLSKKYIEQLKTKISNVIDN